MILEYSIQVNNQIQELENNEFKALRFGGELIEGRRGASGAVVGKNIIIHAGINTKGRYLNDLYHYDIVNNKMI